MENSLNFTMCHAHSRGLFFKGTNWKLMKSWWTSKLSMVCKLLTIRPSCGVPFIFNRMYINVIICVYLQSFFQLLTHDHHLKKVTNEALLNHSTLFSSWGLRDIFPFIFNLGQNPSFNALWTPVGQKPYTPTKSPSVLPFELVRSTLWSSTVSFYFGST